jgi:hypothetical protein
MPGCFVYKCREVIVYVPSHANVVDNIFSGESKGMIACSTVVPVENKHIVSIFKKEARVRMRKRRVE